MRMKMKSQERDAGKLKNEDRIKISLRPTEERKKKNRAENSNRHKGILCYVKLHLIFL